MLDGILPAPRGTPQIEVTFDINADGILEVAAKDKGTGKEQKITITASSGLSDTEIEDMVKDAESHAEEDRQKREEIEIRNTADSTTYAAEKLLSENEDQIPEDLKEEITTNVQSVRDALAGEEISAVNSAIETLQASVQKIGESIYSQTEDPGGPGGTTDPSTEDEEGKDDDTGSTVEGEYREV